MKCLTCGAEMIPGFNIYTFYCPNECDLKKPEDAKKKKWLESPYEYSIEYGEIPVIQETQSLLWKMLRGE